MGDATVDSPARSDERLRGDEPTEDSRTTVVRAEPAIEIGIDSLEVEPLKKAVEMGHCGGLARDFNEPHRGMCFDRHLDIYAHEDIAITYLD